jgi:hypothetical protein
MAGASEQTLDLISNVELVEQHPNQLRSPRRVK